MQGMSAVRISGLVLIYSGNLAIMPIIRTSNSSHTYLKFVFPSVKVFIGFGAILEEINAEQYRHTFEGNTGISPLHS